MPWHVEADGSHGPALDLVIGYHLFQEVPHACHLACTTKVWVTHFPDRAADELAAKLVDAEHVFLAVAARPEDLP